MIASLLTNTCICVTCCRHQKEFMVSHNACCFLHFSPANLIAHKYTPSRLLIDRISPDQLLAAILPKIEAAREAKRRAALRQEVRARVCVCFIFGFLMLNHANPFMITCFENNIQSLYCQYCM